MAINLGFEGYNQFQTGNLDFGRLGVAAATGALGGFGSTIARAIWFGALGNAINNAYQQSQDECNEFDFTNLADSALVGGFGGGLGAGISKIGQNTFRSVGVNNFPVNRPLPPANYGQQATAIGSAIGGALANQ